MTSLSWRDIHRGISNTVSLQAVKALILQALLYLQSALKGSTSPLGGLATIQHVVRRQPHSNITDILFPMNLVALTVAAALTVALTVLFLVMISALTVATTVTITLMNLFFALKVAV